ncbi:MAG: hypothetical protein QOF90_2537 [Acetobacteraceae bacterium]|nr:hypothetical protein [Acetobacteraceae bacterium]
MLTRFPTLLTQFPTRPGDNWALTRFLNRAAKRDSTRAGPSRGCRLSEAPALTADRVDLAAEVRVFESLKEAAPGNLSRHAGAPCPARRARHGAWHPRASRLARPSHHIRLWPWSRMTGWRAMHAVMQAAGLEGVRPRRKGCGTVSGWPPSPPASRSTWYRNGSATPRSARPPSMPVPSVRRRRTSLNECGPSLAESLMHRGQKPWTLPSPAATPSTVSLWTLPSGVWTLPAV